MEVFSVLLGKIHGKIHEKIPENHLSVEVLPSGKRLHNYGKSSFLMGKLTINGHFQ